MPSLLKIGSRKKRTREITILFSGRCPKEKFPDLKVEFYFKESLGDKDLTSPLLENGRPGSFTKDFKEDLLNETVDVVIHSWKDLDLQHEDNTEVISILESRPKRPTLFKKNIY